MSVEAAALERSGGSSRAVPQLASLAAVGHQKAVPWLLSLFLALGPVHWLPGIPPGVVRVAEWLLIVPALGLVFATEFFAGRRPWPSGLLGPAGFLALLVLWIPGLARAAELTDAVDFLIAFGSSCVFFWCFFCIARDSGVVWVVLRRSVVMVGVLAGIALIKDADWNNVGYGVFRAKEAGGLHASSTGWSMGLALFLPLTALLFVAIRRPGPMGSKRLSVIAALLIVSSQFVVGGRSGLLASLLVVGALLLFRSSRALAVVVVVVLLLGGTLVCLGQSCTSHFGVDRLLDDGSEVVETEPEGPAEAAAAVDRFSTLRVQGYALGLEEFAESPIFGHGLRQFLVAKTTQGSVEIHNIWLNWAVHAGLFPPLVLLAMIATILRTGRQVCRDLRRPQSERNAAVILVLVVVAGVFLSFVEEHVPITYFHVSAIWWAAAGTLVGIASRSPGAVLPVSRFDVDPDLATEWGRTTRLSGIPTGPWSLSGGLERA